MRDTSDHTERERDGERGRKRERERDIERERERASENPHHWSERDQPQQKHTGI